MGAVENVVTEVRELIRRSGVDPLKDAPAIQRLVRDAIADYDERSPARRPAAAGRPARRRPSSVLDAVAGFGPLQPYLDDPTVEEIWINEPARCSSPGAARRADRRRS